MWPYLILGAITIVILGYFMFYYRSQARKAIRWSNALKQQTIMDLELSLATQDQLVDELKRRPLRFILMVPEFKLDDVLKTAELQAVSVDACNVSVEASVDILLASAERMKEGCGKITHTMDPWKDDDEDG